MSIHHIIRRQHGVLTRRQARATGLTDRQITRLVACGELVTVHRGVFRHAAIRPSWMSRLSAAVLASGGIVSHRSAAELWNLDIGKRPPIEVTVGDRHRRPSLVGVHVHHTSQFGLAGVTERRGLRVTGIERTVLDCASLLPYDRLESLAEAAIRRRLTTWSRLRTVLLIQARRGRNGSAGLRALLDARLGDPVVPLSDFSRKVVRLLVEAGLPIPVVEHRIVDRNGRFLMQVDLAWVERRCVVELDGLEHHFDRRDRERDIYRRAAVRAEGWRMIEIGWSLFADNPDEVVRLVTSFLDAASKPERVKSVGS